MENYLKNEQISDLHQVRGNRLLDPQNTISISEKERVFFNLVNVYNNSEIILKIKILKELVYYFKDEFMITYALKNSNILDMLLQEINSTIQDLEQLSMIALERILRYRITKQELFKTNGYQKLLDKLDSKNDNVRYNAIKIFYNISKEQDLIQVLHKNNFIKYLIEMFAIEEIPFHQILLNKILSNFLQQNDIATIFLSFSIEDILVEVAFSSTFDVLNSSLQNFLLLSYCKQGKECIISSKVYQKFFKIFAYYHENFSSIDQPKIHHYDINFLFNRIQMREVKQDLNKSFCSFVNFELEDQMNEELFINFFASTCQFVESKNFYAEYQAHELILNFLDYEQKNDQIILACILFLTNMAEHKTIRKELKDKINQIKNLVKDIPQEYQQFAEDLYNIIEWNPQLILINFNKWKLIIFFKF